MQYTPLNIIICSSEIILLYCSVVDKILHSSYKGLRKKGDSTFSMKYVKIVILPGKLFIESRPMPYNIIFKYFLQMKTECYTDKQMDLPI